MSAVLDFAAKYLGVKRVAGGHAKENLASQKVIEKLGFVYDRDDMTPHVDGTRSFDSREYFLNLPIPYTSGSLIETDRLTIREFDVSMTESVRLNSLDEDNRRFVPDEVFETAEEAHTVIRQIIAWYNEKGAPLIYAVFLKNGVHIGHVQAVPADETEWEIGYHIAKEYTGNGYATEAVQAFLPLIMERLSIERIMGLCAADNAASIKVLEKCGFVLEYSGPGAYQGEERNIRRYLYHSF